jgi:hypothetical protein
MGNPSSIRKLSTMYAVSPINVTCSTGIAKHRFLRCLFVFERAPKGCHCLASRERKYGSFVDSTKELTIRIIMSYGSTSSDGFDFCALLNDAELVSGHGFNRPSSTRRVDDSNALISPDYFDKVLYGSCTTGFMLRCVGSCEGKLLRWLVKQWLLKETRDIKP